MTSSHLAHNTVSADSLQGTITVSQPEITWERVRASVEEWLAKQDQFWPQALTRDVLLDEVECIYAAHWILSGAASGNWSASIGVDRKVTEICRSCHGTGRLAGNNVFGKPTGAHCPTCNETGRIQKTVTDWHSQSGVARGSVDQHVIENVANDTPIRCGKRDYRAEEQRAGEPSQLNTLRAFKPETDTQEAGISLAKKLVVNALEQDARSVASRLGEVRDLRLGHMQIESLDARTWLYPIWAGYCQYQGESLLIEIDGITGQLHVDTPSSVRAQRTTHTLKIVGMVILAIVVIVLIVKLSQGF